MTYLKYAKDIISDKIISCNLVKLACQRFLNDLEKGKERGIYFDKKEADRVIDFYNFLPHIKGDFAGKPLLLEPWEQFIIANLFGWKRKDTGKRRFRSAFISVSRKNGKSSLIAGIGLYMLFADNEAGAEIYSAATTRDQAKIVFDIAKHMVQRSKLKKYITHFKTNLNVEYTASKFEPLSSDYNTLDGLSPHAALIDELHAHKTRDLYDVLITAIGARSQPMIISITTAGYDKHSICYEQELYTEKILEGIIKDDSHFGIIYTLDNPEEWENEKNWIKANPNLGISVDLEDLRSKAKKAKEVPTQLNAFLRKNMNIWTESHTRWISTEKWDACGGPVDIEKLKGRLCYGGLDLSTTTDISALVLIFPPLEDGEKHKILCWFYIPQENMVERVRKDKVPYDVWTRQGYIKATPGNIIDYGFILEQIKQNMKDYDFKELAFDRWGSQKIITDLQNLGFEDESVKHGQRHLIDFGQGFASMNSPTKELEKMILSQEICHGDNPVLKWMISNVAIKMDAAGNIKPDKALYIDTPIPTPYGWTTMGNIKIGDVLFNEKGKQCKVIGISEIMENHICYKIYFSDGSFIIADEGHLWTIKDNKSQKEITLTTKEIMKNLTYNNHQSRYAIKNTEPLILSEQQYILNPYLLGAWLGDGHSSSSHITGMDSEILQEFNKEGFKVTAKWKRSKATTYHIENLTKYLYELGVLNNKYIPEGYLRGSIEQRLALLQGLMDTDGHCSIPRGRNGSECVFVNTNENLINGVCELISSLGMKCSKKLSLKALKIGKNNKAWKVSFTAYNDMPVFRLLRKKQRLLSPPLRITRASKRQIRNIIPIDSLPVRCIKVNSESNLFLAGKTMIPTHNSESTDRIDGVVALIMAIDRATRNNTGQSVYEEREILVI